MGQPDPAPAPHQPTAEETARLRAFQEDLDRQDFAIEEGRLWLLPIPEPFCQDLQAVTHAMQLAAQKLGELCKAADVGAIRICLTWDATDPTRQAEIAQRRVAEARKAQIVLPQGVRFDA